jgi:hypothetical protein
MKVCVLGINGYIGSNITKCLIQSGHTVIGTSRNQIDFDKADASEKLKLFLDYEEPKFIVNAIGSIDSKTDFPVKIFNATFLPNYHIFQYYKEKNIEKDTYVLSFGSNSAGKPRVEYPIYAALKGAETALLQTVWEIFKNSKLKWFYSILPRLSGGLGSDSKVGIYDDDDYNLIRAEIEKIVVNFDKISTS